jgi:hypothetical protein
MWRVAMQANSQSVVEKETKLVAMEEHPPTSYKVHCLILGETVPFPIDVDPDETVGDLKMAINESKDLVPRKHDHHLSLYLVNIPEDGNLQRNAENVKLDGLEPLMSTWELKDKAIFPANPPKKTVHILVEVPENSQYDIICVVPPSVELSFADTPASSLHPLHNTTRWVTVIYTSSNSICADSLSKIRRQTPAATPYQSHTERLQFPSALKKREFGTVSYAIFKKGNSFLFGSQILARMSFVII